MTNKDDFIFFGFRKFGFDLTTCPDLSGLGFGYLDLEKILDKIKLEYYITIKIVTILNYM